MSGRSGRSTEHCAEWTREQDHRDQVQDERDEAGTDDRLAVAGHRKRVHDERLSDRERRERRP